MNTAFDHEEEASKQDLVPYSFGVIPRRSIPARLCETNEQRNELLEGTGQYASMRLDPKFTETEVFKYLRLGVSTQVAVAFRALGYPSPESLVECPVVGPMLPDVLARPDREYPLEYIDRCERDGVRASECQAVLRRGVTMKHLEGVLSTKQLTTAFLRNVNREGISLPSNQKTIIDYFVEGVIPVEVQDDGGVIPTSLVYVVRSLLRDDPEYLETLNKDLALFAKFVKAAKSGKKNSVKTLQDLVVTYGDRVLDLNDPLMCAEKVYAEDGSTRKFGYDAALFVEKVIEAKYGASYYWGLALSKSTLTLREKSFNPFDFINMVEAGIEPHEVAQQVLEDGKTPTSLIVAKQDDIQKSLMSGAL